MEPNGASGHPFKERGKLFAMYICFSFVSKVWALGIVLVVAAVTNNSIFVVSMIGFLSSLVVFVLMPQIGRWMDRNDRLLVVKTAVTLKISLITSAYCWCYWFANFEPSDNVQTWEVFCIPLLAAFVAACFATMTQSIEKDWVVVLSGHDTHWLASTNSALSQIDLFCAAVAPALTGVLFGYLSIQRVIVVLVLLNLLVASCLLCLLRSLYQASPELAVRTSSTGSGNNDSIQPTQSNSSRAAGLVVLESLQDFLHCGCCGVLVSYSCLFTTCLSFGPVMIVYLRTERVGTDLIGAAKGGAAVFGCMCAFAYPVIQRGLGLYCTAQVAIVVQASLALLAASTFFWSDRDAALVALMCSLLFIRSWVFDLSVRQIAQESIREAVRGRVNGQWKSLMALFELAQFGLAMLFPDPINFWIPCAISASMTLLSLVLFTMSNPGRTHRVGYSLIPEVRGTVGKVDIDSYCSTEFVNDVRCISQSQQQV